MCECYKIGGKFIAEDPDCPMHGSEAQREQEEMDRINASIEERIKALESKLHDAMCRIRYLLSAELTMGKRIK